MLLWVGQAGADCLFRGANSTRSRVAALLRPLEREEIEKVRTLLTWRDFVVSSPYHGRDARKNDIDVVPFVGASMTCLVRLSENSRHQVRVSHSPAHRACPSTFLNCIRVAPS
jgi:hypothetical protein